MKANFRTAADQTLQSLRRPLWWMQASIVIVICVIAPAILVTVASADIGLLRGWRDAFSLRADGYLRSVLVWFVLLGAGTLILIIVLDLIRNLWIGKRQR